MAKIKMKYKEFELEIEGDESFIDSKVNDFPGILEKVVSNKDTSSICNQVSPIQQLTYLGNVESDTRKRVKRTLSNSNGRLTDTEKQIIAEISHLDRYDVENINKVKEYSTQRDIIMGAILLLFNVDNNVMFNPTILYSFIRKLGLNIDQKIISARFSDMKSYFDKQDNRLFTLSNYGKCEIEKTLKIL